MTSVSWAVDADGEWSDPADWSTGTVPVSTDAVTIDTTDFHTVTHGAGSDRVHSLTVGNDDFVVSGGALTITSGASFAGALALSGGDLSLATPFDATAASFAQSGGTLSGSGSLTVTGSATFTSTAQQIGAGATLVEGAMTLASGAILTLGTGRILTLTGIGSTFAGEVNGAGALVFAGGTQTVNLGTPIRVAQWSIGGGATTSINENLSYAGTFVDGAGSNIDIVIGQALALTGTSTLAGSVSGDAVLDFAGGTQTLNAGANLQMAQLSLSGGAVTTLAANLSYAGQIVQDAGTTLALGADTLALTTLDQYFYLGGSITGTGTLAFTSVYGDSPGADHLIIENGAAIEVSHWSIANHVKIDFQGVLTYGGDFSLAAGTSLILDPFRGGNSLTLTGTSMLAGFVAGRSLVLSGGASTFDDAQGEAHPWAVSLSLTSGVAVTVGSNLTINNRVSAANGTAVSVAATNTLNLGNPRQGPTTTLAGSVTGTGTLAVSGTVGLSVGVSLGISNWSIIAGGVAGLNTNLIYAGAFTDIGEVNTNADTLTLSGSASFTGAVVSGSGALVLQGASAIDVMAIVGSETLDNSGTVTQTGQLTVGAPSNQQPATFFVNAAGGQYDIADDTGIGRGSSTGSTFTNAGVLAKVGGSGDSIIGLAVTNTGTINVASGTLEFSNTVSGAGAVVISAGTLQFDMGFSENAAFSAANGRLVLADSQTYAGMVTDFSHTGGTSFDLEDIGFVSAGEATFSGTATGGVLTITDGAHTASIRLAGDYLGSIFTASSDGLGGTIVVDPARPTAPSQGFVAAMAALAGPTGSGVHANEERAIHTPLLARPHAATA